MEIEHNVEIDDIDDGVSRNTRCFLFLLLFISLPSLTENGEDREKKLCKKRLTLSVTPNKNM